MKRANLFSFTFLVMFIVSAAVEAQQIPYKSHVELTVGQSTIIHGMRGKCGKAAPNWDRVAKRLPLITTGSFSDGGLGTRYSNRCNGETPARAIKFTAEKVGSEQITLYGDPINITVATVAEDLPSPPYVDLPSPPYARGVGGDIRWMDVPQGQLKTKIYGTGSHSENPVLVVVLHGDGGKGPPPSYQYAIAQAIAEGFDKPDLSEGLRQSMGPPLRFDDVVAAGILRPGYTDQDGDRSDGRLGKRTGDNHTRQVTEAVVAAVNTLKQDFNARAVILWGHSGGATISANILALYPDTADAALLVGCGCDMAAARARYYDRTGNPAWSTPTASLDPMTSAHEVPVGKKVRLVVGENDDITIPEDIRRYADVLAANGVDVEMVVAPDHDHNSVVLAPVTFSYLDELVRAY